MRTIFKHFLGFLLEVNRGRTIGICVPPIGQMMNYTAVEKTLGMFTVVMVQQLLRGLPQIYASFQM